jgi:hypothetical protein
VSTVCLLLLHCCWHPKRLASSCTQHFPCPLLMLVYMQVGFNMRKVTKGGVTIKMWDLGGQVRVAECCAHRLQAGWHAHCVRQCCSGPSAGGYR